MSHTTVIKPKPKWMLFDFREIWQYRELFFIFAWRDIKVRYKQTILGAGWAILQPVFSMFIFTIFFGNFAQIPSGELPYPLFVLIGLTFWNFFSQSVSGSSTALISNSNLITKGAFPREILVLASISTRIIDLVASMVVFALLMLTYSTGISVQVFWLVPILLLEISLVVGLGLLFSSLNVYFRDIGVFLPLLMTLWLFLTPVIYTLESVPSQFKIILLLNPMTGIVESVRLSLLLKSPPDFLVLSFSLIISLGTLIFGYIIFKKLERGFADVI